MNISPYVIPGLKYKINTSKNIVFRKGKVTPEEILNIVAKNCGVTAEQIISKTRIGEVVEARHILCGIMRNNFKYGLKSIGDFVGKRDHTTAINSIRTFKNRCELEDGYMDIVNRIVFELDEKIY